MAPDRQTIMETNRSLRTIKTELENLLEKGIIDDETYDSIHGLLPAESSFRAGARQQNTSSSTANLTSPPTDAMSNLNIESQRSSSSPAPPAYSQSGGGPPPAAPSKPVLAHARALYRYNASDARDLNFERDDKIQVHEYMNADWWMGRNTRTGAEGIFPKTYVVIEHTEPEQPRSQPGYGPPQGQPGYGQPGYGQKQPAAVQQLWPPPGQQQYPPPGPPPQQNPYNSGAPPMAMANQGSSTEQQNGDGKENEEEKKDGAGKAKEYGEKFGKKLGNAAIFGAGATLGSNLVNSIF